MPDLNSEQTFSNHDRDRNLDEAAAPETVTETNISVEMPILRYPSPMVNQKGRQYR